MPDPHDLHDPASRSDRRTPAPAPAGTAAPAEPDQDPECPVPTRTAAAVAAMLPTKPAAGTPATTITPAAGPAPCAAAVSRRQHQGARNRHNVLLVAAVAAASLTAGGYFLLSSKSNAITPAAYANQSSRISVAEPAPTAATRAPAAEAPYAAAVPQTRVVFDPPSDYASNSLTADPGCVGYNDATNASSAALGDQPSSAAAAAALANLGAALQQASAEAQDPTLSAALSAEASFVLQAQPTLATALTSGDSDREVAAYQPIEDTDNYVSAVCGSDLDGGGPGD